MTINFWVRLADVFSDSRWHNLTLMITPYGTTTYVDGVVFYDGDMEP